METTLLIWFVTLTAFSIGYNRLLSIHDKREGRHYVTQNQSLAIYLGVFVGVSLIVWRGCLYIYSLEFPHRELGIGPLLLVAVPTVLFTCGLLAPFLPRQWDSKKKDEAHGPYQNKSTNEYWGNTPYSSNSAFNTNNSTASPPPSVSGPDNDWLFDQLNSDRKRESIDRDIEHYRRLGGHDDNIENLKNERDRLN